MAARCPHADVRFCPLYIASHTGTGLGCDDGELQEGICAVARGLSYQANVELLRIKASGLVERAEWAAAAEAMNAQRARNLRLNGIH